MRSSPISWERIARMVASSGEKPRSINTLPQESVTLNFLFSFWAIKGAKLGLALNHLNNRCSSLLQRGFVERANGIDW